MNKKVSAIVLSLGMMFSLFNFGISPAQPVFADPGPAMKENVINGFEDLSQWNVGDGVSKIANTEDKTEGSQSIDFTYSVPDPTGDNAWKEISWNTASLPLDLTAATALKFDLKTAGVSTAGDFEPIHFKLVSANGVAYEDSIPTHTLSYKPWTIESANGWNTYALDLSGIPLENRSAITNIVFYIWNKDSAIEGRTSLAYRFDQMRLVEPASPFVTVEKSINGFEDANQWQANFPEIVTAADTTKTEGEKSLQVTFPIRYQPDADNVWKQINWNASANPVDLSAALALKFDLLPNQADAGALDPLHFKLTSGSNVVYEDSLPAQTLDGSPWTVEASGAWKSYRLDLSSIPAEKKQYLASVTDVAFYVYNKDAAIGANTSLQYKIDHLSMLVNEVPGVSASPEPSAVTEGTAVTLSTPSDGAQIFYTLDGTDPRFSNTRIEYDGPINIQEVTQIKAYAQIGGYNSAVSAFPYTIGTGVAGEELYTIHNNVADTGDGVLAGIGRTTAIGQDGFVNDWSNQTSFKLPSNASKQVKISGWTGDADLSADVSLAYDDDNLYLHVNVKDNIQSDFSGGDIWRGDSVQLAFSKDGSVYGPEYGFSYGTGTPSKFRWNSGSAKLDVDAVQMNVARDETTKETTYDIAMPWLAALPNLPGDKVPFTLLINDNDGQDRRGYIEWTPGIGSAKDATSMGTLVLLQPAATWANSFHGPLNGSSDTPYTYSLTLPNFGTEAADFNVQVPEANLDTQVTVPAGKVVKKSIPITFQNPGTHTVTATVTGGGETKTESIQVSIKRNEAGLRDALDEIRNKLQALEELFAEAGARNIPVDYELVNLTVIKDFIEYGTQDVDNGLYNRADYVVNELEVLYQEAKSNLEAYLSGSKSATAVPKYVSGRPEISGGSFIGATKTANSETLTKRPIFFTGYGHFEQARADIPKFNDYGTNMIQMEIGPNNVVMAPADGSDQEYSISKTFIENTVIPTLEAADEHNVAVSLLLSPHYFPQWAIDKWDLQNNNPGFIKYNINDPNAKKILEAFLRTVIPMVKDYKSLHDIVISNEPNYDSRVDAYAVAPWHQFLEEKYDTIAALNTRYGTTYASFEEVSMPTGKGATLPHYDWTVFNNTYFSDWHAWMAGVIKEMTQDVPLNAKTMAKLDDAVSFGVNPEDYSKISDINGNDNTNFLGSGATGFLKENIYYDLQKSMHEAPVFNSETHVIPDRDTYYGPEQAKHVETSLFQSAVHGKSASAIWVWQRDPNPLSDLAGSILERPDVVKAVGKLSLDLNRLAYEVTALQNVKPQAAILYSLPSLVYSGNYTAAMDKAYEALTFNGQKTGFVSEQQAASGGLSEYKLLIVPQATHVSVSTLTAIKNYMASGGKVIVIGNGSLSMDENNQPLNADDRNAVISGSELIDGAASNATIKQTIRSALQHMGLLHVVLKDKSTGQPIDGVEWQSAEYNGKLLINMANYDSASASKTISIEVDGKMLGSASELINGETVDASDLTVQLEKPYLLSVDTSMSNGGNNNGGGGSSVTDSSSHNIVKDEVITITPALSNGVASGIVTADQFKQAMKDAQADSEGIRTATIELQAVHGADSYAVQLPASVFATNSGTKAAVQTEAGTVLLPLNLFDASALQDAKTIELTIRSVPSSHLPDGVNRAVEISFKADDKVLHWSNPDSPATVSIPYTPSVEEQTNLEHLVIWYIDDEGRAIAVPSGKYATDSHSMVFTATHFSQYAVAYANPKFTDIANLNWARQQIEAMTAKGILSGTSGSRFNPGERITRAEFVDALVKALGLSASFETNFIDVPSTTAYSDSIGVARVLGIALGTGENSFHPDAPITRQEMASVIVRGMKAAGLTVAGGSIADLKTFADAGKVAAYAVENVAALVKGGILQGDGKAFMPAGQVTRAQTAVLMYRLYHLK